MLCNLVFDRTGGINLIIVPIFVLVKYLVRLDKDRACIIAETIEEDIFLNLLNLSYEHSLKTVNTKGLVNFLMFSVQD